MNVNNQIIMEMSRAYEPINRNKKMRSIMERWSRTGLLNKLDRQRSQIVAQLLENQAVELRKQVLSETSTVGAIAGYNKIAFPLVRRTFGHLLAAELVAVQPLSLPSGLLFFLDFKFDRTKSGFTSGGSVYGNMNNAPPNNNPQLDAVGELTASGGFYNLNTGYSRRMFLLSTVTALYSGVTAISEILGGVTVSGYNFPMAASGSTDLGSLHQIRVATSGELTEETGVTFRTLRAIRSLTASSFYGVIDPTLTVLTGNNIIQVFLRTPSTNCPTAPDISWTDGSVTSAVIVGPAMTQLSTGVAGTNNMGDFEATSAIPEVNISVSSVAVQAVTRKLKATWTPELAQDINAYHAIDAEVELTTILSDIISTEIDREIIGQLLSGAAVKAAWSRAIGRYVKWNANNVVTTLVPTSSYTYQAFHGTQKDWYDTLVETCNSVSNEIHKRAIRSGANWMLTNPEVSTILEQTSTFRPVTSYDPTEVQYSLGVEKVGTVGGTKTIYKDPYFPPYILMGYKGPGFLDSGFVYGPYVPLVFTPTIFHPDDLTPRRGAMTRYAMNMIRPEFYGYVVISDVSVLGVNGGEVASN